MSDSDQVALRSARAISAIIRELGTLGKLRAAFGDSKASIQSCSATATIVMDHISHNPFTGGRMSVHVKGGLFSNATSMPMSAEAIIDEVMRLLDAPNAVYMNVSNDHHFVVLPVDGSRVAMLQGFQGSYTLVDWLEWRGVGMLSKSEFHTALSNFLTSSSQETWLSGALTLFSFNLATSVPSGTTCSREEVAQEIRDWFNARPYVKGYGYKPL